MLTEALHVNLQQLVAYAHSADTSLQREVAEKLANEAVKRASSSLFFIAVVAVISLGYLDTQPGQQPSLLLSLLSIEFCVQLIDRCRLWN